MAPVFTYDMTSHTKRLTSRPSVAVPHVRARASVCPTLGQMSPSEEGGQVMYTNMAARLPLLCFCGFGG